MIVVTRLNGSSFAINPDLIERIQESPDTTVLMVDGAQYIVTETMGELIELIARYRARIVSLAARLDESSGQDHPSSRLHRVGADDGDENRPEHPRKI